MGLSISNLDAFYSSTQILHNLSVDEIPRHGLTVLLGPNAAGKSTLFKCIAGLTKCEGLIAYGGERLDEMNQTERFRRVCYMPQSFAVNAALTVFEVVLLASKQLSGWRVSEAEMTAVQEILESLGIEDLAERQIGELSGGQQQLVSLAQAMVREAELLLLDEPTSALDLNKQLYVLHYLKMATEEQKRTIVVSLHDLNLASRFADHVLLMKQGRIVASGDVEAVFQSGEIERTYQIDFEILRSKKNRLVIAPD